MMKRIIFVLILIFGWNQGFAQLSNVDKNKIKVMFFRAQENYDQEDYAKVLKNIEEIEVLTQGMVIATAQNLKVKALVGLKDYEAAEEQMGVLMNLNLTDEILQDLSSYSSKIEDEIAKLVAEKARKAEADRIAREKEIKRQKAIEAQKRKEAEIFEAFKNGYESILAEELDKLMNLSEGKFFELAVGNRISKSTSEKSYFTYYGDKYLIFTIPSANVVNKMDKEKAIFRSSDAASFDDYVTTVKVKNKFSRNKSDYSFKRSFEFKNVFFGGAGNEILWNGQQYVDFEYELNFFYYTSKLHVDGKVHAEFDENHYNPYFESGTMSKSIDYRIVSDDLLAKVKELGIADAPSSDASKPNRLKVTFDSHRQRKMLLSKKTINYTAADENVKGVFSGGGYRYEYDFLYYVPKTSASYYTFVNYTDGFSGNYYNFIVENAGYNRQIIESRFDNVYQVAERRFEDEASRSFTNEDYTMIYTIFKEILPN